MKLSPVPESERLYLAWLAGFFDGEGCVTIEKRNGKYESLRVTIHGNFPEILREIKERFGGHLKLESEKTGHWYIVANDALRFLKAITEYSRVKKKEIRLGIKFQSDKMNLKASTPQSDRQNELLRRQQIGQNISYLNKVRNVGKKIKS